MAPRALALLIVSALLCSCSVRRGPLAHQPERQAPIGGAEALDYDLTVRWKGEDDPSGVRRVADRLEPLLRRAVPNAGPVRPDAPLQLSVEFAVEPGYPGMELPLFLTLVTTTVFPAYLEFRYELSASARWRGAPLGTYRYDAGMGTLYWLPLAPLLLVETPREFERETIDDLIEALLNDVERDLRAREPEPEPAR